MATGKFRFWPVGLALTLAASSTLVSPASASPLEAKKQQASQLSSRIAAQGEQLSLADERFNQARLGYQRISGRAEAARAGVVVAEKRWKALKSRLGTRVRTLYKHPGAVADALLGARSLGDLARARVYGSSVLTADTALVMETERARQLLLDKAHDLEAARRSADRKQKQISSERSNVQAQLRSMRALRSRVNADVGRLIAQERQRQLAAARAAARAPAAASRSGSVGTVAGAPAAEESLGPAPPVRGSAGTAVATARAQMGKPYEWGADGPNSFDCSGLTMYAWSSAGVQLPHSSGAQYSSLPHVSRANLAPGDLVFFGSPIHHVGIYEGGGMMINAPETGENVRRDSISRADYAGAARP